MARVRVSSRLAGFTGGGLPRPELNRALRSTVAFMIPMLAIHAGWLKLDPVMVCIASHTISLIDVRGSYGSRLVFLLGVTLVLCAAVALGELGTLHLGIALAASAMIFVGGGLWRHLSADYGPGLAVSSGLMFCIVLGGHPPPPDAWARHPVWPTLTGALFATLLHVLLWPIRPQHPLRKLVGDCWLALGEWLGTLDDGVSVSERELEFRAALNHAHAGLDEAKGRQGALVSHLEALNLSAVRLAVRTRALRTALESAIRPKATGMLDARLAPLVRSLSNLARTVAMGVITRQPEALATFEVRMKRLRSLLEVARARMRLQLGESPQANQLDDLIRQLEAQLPLIHDALRRTVERASERAAFSLELSDLSRLNMRSLVNVLHQAQQRPEPALLRHTLRVTVLGLLGIAVFRLSGFPHGYWLPFTMLIVLQPDFGSTRQKAAERVLGTLVGGVIASSLLWLHPPLAVVLTAVAITIFLFGFFLKRSYGIAVVFITLMVVLVTESYHPVTIAFTLERMGATLTGGLLALSAAWIFWPTWERSRFPAIFSKALGAARELLDGMIERLRDGGIDDEALAKLRHAAETTNAEAFSSLRRMIGDPKNRQDALQQSAALANGNQRVIDALAVIALHLDAQRSLYPELLERFAALAGSAFETLMACEMRLRPEVPAEVLMRQLEAFQLPDIRPERLDPDHFREPWVWPQLLRIVTELNAMLLIIEPRKHADAPHSLNP